MTNETRYENQKGRPFGAPATEAHPFIVEVKPIREEWAGNGLSFETAADADAWGFDLLLRWFGAEDYRVKNAITGDIVREPSDA